MFTTRQGKVSSCGGGIKTPKKNVVTADDASLRYRKSCSMFDTLIAAANSSFGSNNWSHSVTSHNLDFVEHCVGNHSAGATACVKVTMKTGIHHEGIGIGTCYCAQSQGLAVLIARKESMVNALREALRCFGEPLVTKIEDLMPHECVLKQSLACSIPNGEWNSDVLNSPLIVQGGLSEITPNNNTRGSEKKSTSDDERRQERIRKQRQKQEEFKQKMRLKSNNFSVSNGVCNSLGTIENNSNGWGKFDDRNSNFANEENSVMGFQDMDSDIFNAVESSTRELDMNSFFIPMATPQKTMWEVAKESKLTNTNNPNTVNRKLFLGSNRNIANDVQKNNVMR